MGAYLIAAGVNIFIMSLNQFELSFTGLNS